MNLTHKIVRRLLRDDEVGFSRNQNYEAYEDPKVKRAVRIFRHLRSVEEDLLEIDHSGEVALDAVEREPDRVVVRLSFGGNGARRVSFLTPSEWGLLLENKRVTDILRGLLDHAGDKTRETIESMIA
ncbi:MAG: hypothetical protein ACLFVJ_04665 [Persicimonas sp.]